MSRRYPGIARACFHLDWIFLLFWTLYLLGPDVIGVLRMERGGRAYALLAGGLFLIHFVLISTGIIALFVVIIQIHPRRPLPGFGGGVPAPAPPAPSLLFF